MALIINAIRFLFLLFSVMVLEYKLRHLLHNIVLHRLKRRGILKKPLFLVFMFFIVLSLSAEWIEVNRDGEMFAHTSYGLAETEVNFSLPGYELETVREDGVEYQKIGYQFEGELLEVGKPDLPCFTRLIAIPNQGEVNLRVLDYQEETISDILIYPQQELQSESQSHRDIFTIDEAFYNSGNIFPAEMVVAGTPAIIRGLRVVNLTINPFRYDPVSHELKIVTNVNILVNTAGNGGENTITRGERKLSRAFEPLYEATVLNYESSLSREDNFQDPSYLFVYINDNSVEDNLAYLTDWKHEKGFEVATYSVNSGTSFSTIKAYIQTAYNTWENPPEFVCLVGDAEGTYNIPTDYISNGGGDQGYARLEGNDILADVYVGRLSFSSLSELQAIVYKILYYEKIPYMAQTDWYEQAVLVGDPSHSGTSTSDTKRFVKQMMLQHNPDFTFNEYYNGNYSTGMSTSINSGVSYLNYRGYLGMSGFDNSNISALNNGFMLPIAVFPTCGTGTFYSGTSRSEAFLRVGTPGQPKGAVAAYGTATTSTHTCFNNCIDAGTYYGLFADHIFNMGGALTRGKLALYENYPNQSTYVQNFSYWNTLMGDPGMEVWTGVPQALVVTYDNQLAVGANTLSVHVQNASGTPMENAWVTALLGDDDIFATGYTDVNGDVVLEIAATTSGTASLTVTKHNYIPHLGSFAVGDMDRFVNIFAYEIDDDNTGSSVGNGDGAINPGETIELRVSLKNFGTSSANGVSAVINTNSSFVTIGDDTEDYGTIAAGASVYSADDFDFTVAADALNGMEVSLNFTITDNLGNSWQDHLALPVVGSYLYVTDQAFPGNPNSMLEPGETSNLSITLENLGTVTAEAIYGTLSLDDDWFTLDDAEGYFGNIAGGSQATNNTDLFQITANALIIPGSQYTGEILLYNATGYSDTVTFTFTVGSASITDPVGPDAYGYYCYDDGDVDYYNVPVYDWVEISGIGTNLNLSDPGETGAVTTITGLPISFYFYGIEYDALSICSNGWVAPGITGNTSFMNWEIPGPLGPSPQIAVFWDDLITSTGGVYYYYDSVQHYVVVEWSNLKSEYNDSFLETFEVIIYDSNFYPMATGDSELKFQYQEFNNIDVGSYPSRHGQYCTIGIEDHTGTRGLEYTYDNTYPDQAKLITDGTALLFTGEPIQFEEPYLVVGSITLDDESGNNNGLADYGESVDLYIALNNMGEQTATGVSATLSCTDEYITLNQTSSLYDPVIGGASSTNLTGFAFDVAEDCPDAHNALFTLNVVSNEDTWELSFHITLNAPNPEFRSIFIDDNDNNILDPGETTDIYVSYLNEGGAAIFNTNSEITTTADYLTINSATYYLGDFTPGSVVTAVYNVTVLSSANMGDVANMTTQIDGDLNYAQTVDFMIRIGFINEDFETGNFESFDWEMSGAANWTIVSDAYEGMYCARSGAISHNQTSSLSLTMDVLAAGEISFYKKVSSENNYDYLKFYINNQLQGSWCGTSAWSQETYNVSAGSDVEFVWTYSKDGSVSTGSDCGWIDYIVFPPGGAISNMGFLEGSVTLSGGNGNVQDVLISADQYISHPDANGDYMLPLLSGTYDVSAQLEGYNPVMEENVNIISNQSTTIDFSLIAFPSPTNLQTEVLYNDVTLIWEMPIEESAKNNSRTAKKATASSRNVKSVSDETRELSGYKIYRNNVMINEISDPAILEYFDGGLAAGDYEYYVTAVYDDYVESSPSNLENVTIELTPPSDLEFVIMEDDVVLTWSSPTESRSLCGYNVYKNNEFLAETTEATYLDENLTAGTYTYYVTALYDEYESEASNEVIVEMTASGDNTIPATTCLKGNYPNPFNPTTTINFATTNSSVSTQIEVYNLKGQKVKTLVDKILPAGYHSVVWNGRDDYGKQVASGVYLYQMKAGHYQKTNKMILLQ